MKGSEEKTIEIEAVISGLLYWGVTASLILIAGGTVLSFVHSADYGAAGGTAADLKRLLAGDEPASHRFARFGNGLLHLQGEAVIIAGLILLIATPVVRVAVSIYAFAVGGDRTYVWITSVVLALLLLSFALGKAG